MASGVWRAEQNKSKRLEFPISDSFVCQPSFLMLVSHDLHLNIDCANSLTTPFISTRDVCDEMLVLVWLPSLPAPESSRRPGGAEILLPWSHHRRPRRPGKAAGSPEPLPGARLVRRPPGALAQPLPPQPGTAAVIRVKVLPPSTSAASHSSSPLRPPNFYPTAVFWLRDPTGGSIAVTDRWLQCC